MIFTGGTAPPFFSAPPFSVIRRSEAFPFLKEKAKRRSGGCYRYVNSKIYFSQ
jgi:hypothetical protein